MTMPNPGTPVTLEHLALIFDSGSTAARELEDPGLSHALAFMAEEATTLAIDANPDRLDPMPAWWPRWLELRQHHE